MYKHLVFFPNELYPNILARHVLVNFCYLLLINSFSSIDSHTPISPTGSVLPNIYIYLYPSVIFIPILLPQPCLCNPYNVIAPINWVVVGSSSRTVIQNMSKSTQKRLTEHKIKILPWTSQSPDLNLWAELKKRVQKRGSRALICKGEWSQFPFFVFYNLIKFYERRLCCFFGKGRLY